MSPAPRRSVEQRTSPLQERGKKLQRSRNLPQRRKRMFLVNERRQHRVENSRRRNERE